MKPRTKPTGRAVPFIRNRLETTADARLTDTDYLKPWLPWRFCTISEKCIQGFRQRAEAAAIQVTELKPQLGRTEALAEDLKQQVELLRADYREGGISRYTAGGLSSGRCTLADQKLPVDVPRVRNVANHTEVPLDVYQALQTPRQMDGGLLLRMLKGIATRNDEACAETVPEAFGLSRSSVSRRYVKGTARKLAEFQERSLEGYDRPGGAVPRRQELRGRGDPSSLWASTKNGACPLGILPLFDRIDDYDLHDGRHRAYLGAWGRYPDNEIQ